MKRGLKKYLFAIMVAALTWQTAYATSQGGNFEIRNMTDQTMVKTGEHSYQMEKWNLPNTIPGNSSHTVRVEFQTYVWSSGIFEDDAADTYYQLTCKDGKIDSYHIMARVAAGPAGRNELSSPYLLVKQTGNNCSYTLPIDGKIGWQHNGTVTLGIVPK